MTSENKDSIPVEDEEEISVLKSIFNEDFRAIDEKEHLYAFDLIIRLNSLPKKMRLIHDDSQTSTDLSHLPPITLRVRYPKTSPPLFCILCDYLTGDRLLFLANQMDSIRTDEEAMVYRWVELIKEYFDSLSSELRLLSSKCSVDDPRFLTNYDRIESRRIYEQLVDFNRMEDQLEFEQTNHLCPICLEEKSGKVCLLFEKCPHYACLSCLHEYALECLANIQEMKQINCFECQSSLYFSEVRRIFFSNDQLLMKYQQSLFEQTMDLVWCPRCQHSIIYIPSESRSGNHPSFVECFHCRWTFCRRCEQSWHPQIQCPKDELVRQLAHTPRTQISKADLQKILIEMDNFHIIEQSSKPCPSCYVRIEKNGGCNHMQCLKCRVHFCWLCGWFAYTYGSHVCRPKPEKSQLALPTEMQEKLGQILNNPKSDGATNSIGRRAQTCPKENCGQTYMKVRTSNMLRCEKCEISFCFICGEEIYGAFHFSPYGCKENTPI